MSVPIMSFPEAFAYVREVAPNKEDHDPRCSWSAGMLCDCAILWDEYERRKAAQCPSCGRQRTWLHCDGEEDWVCNGPQGCGWGT